MEIRHFRIQFNYVCYKVHISMIRAILQIYRCLSFLIIKCIYNIIPFSILCYYKVYIPPAIKKDFSFAVIKHIYNKIVKNVKINPPSAYGATKKLTLLLLVIIILELI